MVALLCALPMFLHASIESGKVYRLKHVSSSLYLSLSTQYNETNAVNATTLQNTGTWFLATGNSTDGFTLTAIDEPLSLGVSSTYFWNSSNSHLATWTVEDAGTDTYYLSTTLNNNSTGYLFCTNTTTGSYIYTNGSQTNDAKWQFEALFTATAPISLRNGWHQVKWVNTNSDTNTDYTDAQVEGKYVTNYAQDVTVSSKPYALYIADAPSTLNDIARTLVYIDNYTSQGGYGMSCNIQSANGHYITQDGSSSLTGSSTNYVIYYSSESYPTNSTITSGTGGTRYSLVPCGRSATPYIGQTASGKFPMCQFSPISLDDLGLTAYTVHITGYEESAVSASNLQVRYTGDYIYGNTSAYNGGHLFFGSGAPVVPADFEVPELSGYLSQVSISGTDINVKYFTPSGVMTPAYTLSTPARGSVFAKNTGTTLYGSASTSYGETFNPSDTHFQFAYIETSVFRYLYNIGTQQFVTSASSRSSSIPTTYDVPAGMAGHVQKMASTNTDYKAEYPTVLQVGEFQINLSTNGHGVYSWNDTGDPGNGLKIEEVGSYDLAHVQAMAAAQDVVYIDQLLALAGTGTYGGVGSKPYKALAELRKKVANGTASSDVDANYAIVKAYCNANFLEVSGYPEIDGTTLFSNKKVYFVLPYDNNRGTYYYAPETTTTYMYSTYKAGVSMDETDVNQQIAAFTVNDKSYYFSIGAQKFFTASTYFMTLTDVPTDASLAGFGFSTGSYTTYPFVLKANNKIFGISNGQTYPIYFWESTADGGNAVRIFEVGDIDELSYWTAMDGIYNHQGSTQKTYTITYTGLPSNVEGAVTIGGIRRTTTLTTYIPYGTEPFALSDIVPATVEGYKNTGVSVAGSTINITYESLEESPSVDITYIYKYGETEWYRETKRGVVGQSYPALVGKPENVTFDIPERLILGKVTADEEVVIACTLDNDYWLKPSTSYTTATWYYLNIHDTYHYYLAYQAANEYLNGSATNSSNTDVYKWAFVGNPITGYKIYNKNAGASRILTSLSPTTETDYANTTGGLTYPHMVVESEIDTENYNIYWEIANSNSGFMLKRKGEDVYCNYRNSTLGYWNRSDGGSRMYLIPTVSMTAISSLATLKDKNGNALSASKTYRLVNRSTGLVISDTDAEKNLLTMAASGAGTVEAWKIAGSSSTFTIRNSSTNNYIALSANSALTQSESANVYIYTAETVDGVPYYYISYTGATLNPNGNNNGRTLLNYGGSQAQVIGSAMGHGTQWYFEEYTDETPATHTYATSITTGYYRIIDYGRSGGTRAMVDNYGKVSTVDYIENFTTLWKITKSGDTYTFQNAQTGQYIQDNRTSSSQDWTTGSSSSTFNAGETSENSEGQTLFTFKSINGPNVNYGSGGKKWGFHCDQYFNVVSWEYDAAASKWLLEPVTLSSEEQAALATLQDNTNYTSQLRTFFDDYACTQLKSTYASKTDDELRSAMSSLPTVLQEMAVRVKNDTWNSNAIWNHYEKDFRIHDYEVYNEPSVWANKLGYGPFSRLTQPTGIRVNSGEIVYLFVNDDVADSDGHLYLEIVSGVNITGAQVALNKGYNKITSTISGELFITYNCNNTETLLSTYPDIKIHIEGGACNGAFDMTRGHADNDWYWLAQNMFSDTYVHIRSNNTLFCCYLDRVKSSQELTTALSIWDWVFTTEERIMSNYFGTDYYRPVCIIYDSTEGAPNWSGYPGSAVGRVANPGIYASGSFSYKDMLYGEGKWVISHEEGHGHQQPYNLAGTTEASNNSLGQMIEYLWGYRTSRGTAQSELIDLYNQGFSWVDMVRATNRYSKAAMNDASANTAGYADLGTKSIWLINKMWYQLWLYFHLKGDDGFFPRFIAELVKEGGIEKSTQKGSPASYLTDYMRLARAACKAANTDLYEFFKVWGFFNYGDAINTNNTVYNNADLQFTTLDGELGDGIYAITDYSTYYIKMPLSTSTEDVATLQSIKEEMQAYENKAPGILFINDTGELLTITEDKECVRYDASLVGATQVYYDSQASQGAGSTGHFQHFGTNEANSLQYTISGNTVTVTGSGAAGFKIYGADGELSSVHCTTTFTLTDEEVAGLNNGTFAFVATLGTDKDIIINNSSASTATLFVYDAEDQSTQIYRTKGADVSSYTGTLKVYVDAGTLEGDVDLSAVQPGVNNNIAGLNVNDGAYAKLSGKDNVIYSWNGGNSGEATNLVLTDKADYWVNGTNFSAKRVNYTRTNTQGYNTVCLPWNIAASEFTSIFGTDAKVYVLTSMDGSQISFDETNSDIAAGTPILVYNPTTTSWNFSQADRNLVTTAGETETTGATLTGAFLKQTLGEGFFKLNSAGTRFVRTTASSTITPFRFYLQGSELSAGVRQFYVMFNDLDETTVTGIGTVDADGHLNLDRQPIYDLQGRRVTQPQRGQIYIIGGKRVRL